MEVAARSYLTAGIAAVGATALIAAPIAPAPPDITVRADDLSAVFSDYTPTALSSALLGLPSTAAIRDALGNLTLGGLGAFNIGLAGAADAAGIGATAFSDIAASMALTGQTMNTALVAGFLAAIGFEVPAGDNASAAAATTLVSTADIRDAIGNLTLGFLTAVNAGLGGMADVADIGAVAFSDIAASLALTGQTVATALTAGFLAAIGFEMPAEGGVVTASAARTMVSTNDLRDAVGNLTLGFLTAVNATLGGLADAADIGAVAFSDIVTSLAVTGQTAATALTSGFLAAIGFQVPDSTAPATAAAAMVSPGGIRDAVGNLTLGFLGAFNAGLGGLADVADIGAVAFSDIAASLALTGQTAATALTAGFLAAIGFQVPTEEQTSTLATAAMVSPGTIRDAVGNLTLGGLAAFNASLAGLADVADIGAVAFSDIAASLAQTGQTAATALTAGFLAAIGFQPPVEQATATAASLVSPGTVRDAVGNLTLGGLAALNASLAGLADVADIGAVAFSDISASLAQTGQTAATALTAGFLAAIGFQVPQPEAPETVGPAALPQTKALVNVSLPKAELASGAVDTSVKPVSNGTTETAAGAESGSAAGAEGAPAGSAPGTDATDGTPSAGGDTTGSSGSESGTGTGGDGGSTGGTDSGNGSTGTGSEGDTGSTGGTGAGSATDGDDTAPAPTKRDERKQLRDQQSQDRKATRVEQKADRADNQESTRAERTAERKAQAAERKTQRQADKQERKTQRQQHNGGSDNGGSGGGSNNGGSDNGGSGGSE
ncbi:hypothetical protein A5742_18705 [Mycolicibacterium fortuitum]|uniref:PE-PGRS family protein n=1 Tax=Mycolicibacterium fortuitum TaxID=1766 RepID=A0ABD6QSC5_MYCFO|nr:hypothetical protein [Mycolicibacterium fortuitum]OMC51241.1 hypothetical protein A5742_18705 [Mycolicibacterium fortuitum]